MLKLLLILAAAAIIAAAAHSAPLELQDLEDVNADPVLADVADDLDLNDELDLNDDVDEQADNPETDTEPDDELLSDDELDLSDEPDDEPDEQEKGKRVELLCNLGSIFVNGRCKQCPPDKPATSYGSQNDDNKCQPCAEGFTFDKVTSLCVNNCNMNQLEAQADFIEKVQDNVVSPEIDELDSQRFRLFAKKANDDLVVQYFKFPRAIPETKWFSIGSTAQQCFSNSESVRRKSSSKTYYTYSRSFKNTGSAAQAVATGKTAGSKGIMGIMNQMLAKLTAKMAGASKHGAGALNKIAAKLAGGAKHVAGRASKTFARKAAGGTKTFATKAAGGTKTFATKAAGGFKNVATKAAGGVKNVATKAAGGRRKLLVAPNEVNTKFFIQENRQKKISKGQSRKISKTCRELENRNANAVCPARFDTPADTDTPKASNNDTPAGAVSDSNTPADTDTPKASNNDTPAGPGPRRSGARADRKTAKTVRRAGRSPAKIPMSVVNFCKTQPKGKKQRVCLIIENLQMQGLLLVQDDTPADSETPSVNLQTKSCGKICCLAGWYGNGGASCKQCPVTKPSSPRTGSGGPDKNCKCPNAEMSSCFQCNICAPFNPVTGVCTKSCDGCFVQKNSLGKPVAKCPV
jgi:hypothetical protein